jgi:cyclic pyranopterin phosphate synthase
MTAFSHFDEHGQARMVDVSAKSITERVAVARGIVTMLATTADIVRKGTATKGDVLAVARLAGISGSKWTSHLIPLCHSIPIESVKVSFEWLPGESPATERLDCLVTVKTTAKTGVEMEALTATSIVCLTVYDMLKSVDREIAISQLKLIEKSGGKSGFFQRKE